MQQPTGGTPRPDADSTDRDQAPANPPIQRLSGRASRALRDRVRSRAAAVSDGPPDGAAPIHLRRARPPDRRCVDRGGGGAPRVVPPPRRASSPASRGSTTTNPRLAVERRHLAQQTRLALGALNAADGGSGNKVAVSTPDPSFESLVIPGENVIAVPSSSSGGTHRGPAGQHQRAPGEASRPSRPMPENAIVDDGTLVAGRGRHAVEDGASASGYRVRATRSAASPEVRRVDDDPVVGEQAQDQGRAPHRPDPDDPAGERPRRDGQARPTRSTRSRAKYKVDEAGDRRRQRARGSEPRRRPGARRSRARSARPIPTPKPAPGRRSTRPAAAVGGGSSRRARHSTAVAGSLARRRRRQLHQPVLPLRPLRRSTSRPTTGTPRAGRGRRHGHLRRLEEQRRRLPGLDRPRLRAVHDLQPHVGDHGRPRPERRRAASRSGGSGRPATPPGPHLHFEVWRGPVWAGGTGSTRSRTSRPPGSARRRSAPGRRGPRAPAPCDNRPDVPRPRQDLRARRRRRRRRGDVPAGGPRPARRPGRRRRRSRRLGLPPGRCRPDDPPRLPLSSTTSRRRPGGRGERLAAARQGRRGPRPRRPAGHGASSTTRPASSSPTSSRSARRRWSRGAVAAGSATRTSRRPPTRPRSTPRRASPARSAGCASSSGSSPTSAWSACRTPASRRCSRR